MVAVGDAEHPLDALEEALGILLPGQVVQEHPHGGEAEAFGPAEFLIDGRGIEGLCLPPLQFIDGAARQVVRAGHPRWASY
jgi:hypothetical protein